MHAPGDRVDLPRQRIDVGRADLRQLAPAQYRLDGGVRLTERLEGVRVGRPARRGLARPGQLELLEQHVRELLWRADLELVPDRREHLVLRRLRQVGQLRAEDRERLAVDGEAVLLHARQHRQVRQVDLPEDAVEVVRLEIDEQLAREAQRRVGGAGGEVGRVLGVGTREGDRLAAPCRAGSSPPAARGRAARRRARGCRAHARRARTRRSRCRSRCCRSRRLPASARARGSCVLPLLETRCRSGSVNSARAASRTASRGSWTTGASGSGASIIISCCPSFGGSGSRVCPNGRYQPLPRLDAEREPDEAVGRAHRVLVVGQQLEAEAPRRLHRLDHLAEALSGRHDLVLASAGDCALGLPAVAGRVVGVLRQPPDERAELQLLEQGEHGRAVVVVHERGAEVERNVGDVGDDRGHALVVAGVLDGGGERPSGRAAA